MKKNMSMACLLLTIVYAYALIAAERDDHAIAFFVADQASMADLPFSAAVRVGPILYLSGQLGVETNTAQLVPGGIKAEAQQALENIKATLNTYHYSMSDVVKCTVMLADINEWQQFNAVYLRYFSKPYPARSAFAVSGLARHARVEVECMAAKDARVRQ